MGNAGGGLTSVWLAGVDGSGRGACRSWGRGVRCGAMRLGNALERPESHKDGLGMLSELLVALGKQRRRKGELESGER